MNLERYGLIAALALLVLSIIGNALLFDSWQDAKTEATQCGVASGVLADTNAGERQTIEDLKTKLVECVGAPQKVQQIVDSIDESFDARFAALQTQLERDAAERARLYDVTQCAALRASPVCRELDQRLRRKAGSGPNRTR